MEIIVQYFFTAQHPKRSTLLMIYKTIIYEKKENIGVITLNCAGTMNTLKPQVITELGDVINAAADDPEVKVVVLQSTGKVFCAGGDFEALDTNEISAAKTVIAKAGSIIKKMYKMNKPIICAVQGAAVGCGASLALSCDFIIASEKAFFSKAFAHIGLIPNTDLMWGLTRMVGVARAKELTMSERNIKAEEALRYSLVLEVVPEEKLQETTMALARKLAGKPQNSIASIKYIANRLNELTMSIYFELEADLMGIALKNKNHIEKLHPVSIGV
jgi:2-(1,2-epoxy-1,2-dihydrophenyl)acetyl-CoA isomerase